jgi:hypothetical protein
MNENEVAIEDDDDDVPQTLIVELGPNAMADLRKVLVYLRHRREPTEPSISYSTAVMHAAYTCVRDFEALHQDAAERGWVNPADAAELARKLKQCER